MPGRDKMGEGRTAVTLAKQGVEDAISRWQDAPDTEKGTKAQNVLMHIGSHPGIKLSDFADTKTVSQIKADFASKNK